MYFQHWCFLFALAAELMGFRFVFNGLHFLVLLLHWHDCSVSVCKNITELRLNIWNKTWVSSNLLLKYKNTIKTVVLMLDIVKLLLNIKFLCLKLDHVSQENRHWGGLKVPAFQFLFRFLSLILKFCLP